MKFKNYNSNKRKVKRTPNFYLNKKKRIGARTKALKKFNYHWALDVPNTFPKSLQNNIFENKCILTSCILGLLQNAYFKSNKIDKRYQKAQYINSTLLSHKNIAGKIISEELTKMLSITNLPPHGPYELNETAKILSETYKCQIIVFDGISNSKKISFMYPTIYDDELIPIYLFEPLEAPNHFVFIRHLNSYFRSNMKVCFGCHKTFKGSSIPIKHLCPKKATCFSCRRFFQSINTYVHSNLAKDFCNKNISNETPFDCQKCNLTMYSQHCFEGHKRFCYGKNISFGMKCKFCNIFTYKGNSSTNIINHKCGAMKMCKYCFECQEPNHLCKLKKEIVNSNWPRIGFISSASYDNLPDKCNKCPKFQKCTKNCSKDFEFEIFLIFIYREENVRGSFTKYVISKDLNVQEKEDNVLNCQYYKNITKYPFKKYNQIQKKTTDFERNYELLMTKDYSTLISELLKLTMDKDYANTTYICQNSDSTTFVSYCLKFHFHKSVLNSN